MVPFESLDAVSYSPSIVTMVLSCISSETKLDIGRKSWFIHTPIAFGAPVRGSPSEYCHPVWYGKTRMVGLPEGEKSFEDMCNRLHTIPACDWRTDGRTDRQTSCQSIVRAMHMRRAVKTNFNKLVNSEIKDKLPITKASRTIEMAGMGAEKSSLSHIAAFPLLSSHFRLSVTRLSCA